MSARRPTDQLTLLDVPVFAGGPARLPKTRSTRPASPSTLLLPFDPEAARLKAEAQMHARVEERLRDALRPKSPAPPPPAPAAEQAAFEQAASDPDLEAPPAAEGPVTEWLFGWRRKPTDRERGEAFARLAAHLGAPAPRRVTGLEVREEGDRLVARLEGQVLRVVATGAGARARWRLAVTAAAREAGLVEPE